MSYDSLDKQDYVEKRVQEFLEIPAEELGFHAHKIFENYMMIENKNLRKKDVDWFSHYISSFRFLDCESQYIKKQQVNDEHKKSLSYLASMEYEMINHDDDSYRRTAENAIEYLDNVERCLFD